MSKPEEVVSKKLFQLVTGGLTICLGIAVYNWAYYKEKALGHERELDIYYYNKYYTGKRTITGWSNYDDMS